MVNKMMNDMVENLNVIYPAFVAFPKIARLRREIVVTEKIDGTNSCILVPERPEEPLLAGKRSGWIFPGPTDNFWFAQWVQDHAAELRAGLGPGLHFGEWWGERINKRYPTVQGRKFSLFNTERWRPTGITNMLYGEKAVPAPACCSVVPVLSRAARLNDQSIEEIIVSLREHGSFVAPGCKAEGIVVYHTAAKTAFKVTCEKDNEWKGNGDRITDPVTDEMAEEARRARAEGGYDKEG
jgi:hypothetical protein